MVRRSLEIIIENQHETGAFPAALDYAAYDYSWIRDGAFIAHALDRFGFHEPAKRFHRWTADTLSRHRHKVEALEAAFDGRPPKDSAALHTRYRLDGSEGDADWGNFQLDGYGFWLVSLSRHLQMTGTEATPYREAIDVVARYLALAWRLPCYDCWEEYPSRRHPTTLAAIAAGMQCAEDRLDVTFGARTAHRILAEIGERGVIRGAIVKLLGESKPTTVQPVAPFSTSAIAGHERPGRPLPADASDGSALLVLGSFGPYTPDSGIVTATLARIEAELVVEGGVHRYLDDEYYGGGLWLLLSGALAALHAERGDINRATEVIAWIEQQADSSGNLPEQIATALRNPDHLEPWIARWGPIGKTLLWSHAMYLIAVDTTWPGRFNQHSD